MEASIDKSQTYLVINKVLNLLDPKEKLVIVLTYGFYGKERKTQQEIAAILGLSRSYVATILGSALNNIVILLKREWELEENFNMKARRKSPIIPLSDRFPGYTEEDYWNVITTLKEEERALIFKRYGIDLKNTASSDEWNYAESKDPYNAVIKKLASRLEALAKQKKLGVKR